MARNNSRFPVSNPVDSFWTSTPHHLHNHRSTSNLPQTTEILIIGSGYAGTATAYHLLQNQSSSSHQPSILILEARKACSGATGRNGGHLKPDVYFNVLKYSKMYGPEQAARMAAFEAGNVLAVKELVERERLDCDFHLTRAVDVCLDEEHARATEKAYRELMKIGVADLRDVAFEDGRDAERISGVKGAKCCFTFTAGHVHPVKMVLSLLEILIAKGVNLQTHTPATGISSSADFEGYWTVQTPRGFVRAKKVVFATNGYTAGILPQYSDRIIPVRGICSRITTPLGIKSPHITNTYSPRHNADAYDYLIPRADGSIVVGGGRPRFWTQKEKYYDNVDDSTLISGAEDYFDHYMQKHFQGWENSTARTDQIWTGIMGYTSDFMAHVGTVPEKPGLFILAGFNGHGMPQILGASKAVAKMITDDCSYEETGLPSPYKTTKERLTEQRNPLMEGLEGIWARGRMSKL